MCNNALNTGTTTPLACPILVLVARVAQAILIDGTLPKRNPPNDSSLHNAVVLLCLVATIGAIFGIIVVISVVAAVVVALCVFITLSFCCGGGVSVSLYFPNPLQIYQSILCIS